ncbi:hypothetical protein GZ77_25860 [Endozoicomonas montiporae]|uniref:OmpA-like domain-containing protein n=1 Tax=Endozoicomonas montiporae TaxID=1027273 RepID=A0A081MYP3_9GAMM|nr:hypothetical protein [Endozoicomonas montiporae]KEQ11316.1 hypothetical protein GZ77_25860 [Endozoicomonas montiporae]
MAKKAQSNPWPGFVDALSTTLLVFVFLVVVLILVVTALSVQVGLDIAQSSVEAEHAAAGATEGTESGQLATVEADFDKEIISEATSVDLKSQVSTEVKNKLIRIKYNDYNSRLADVAQQELEAWIADNLDNIQGKTVYIISLLNTRSLAKTVAYEIAFNRITQVRQILLANGLSSEYIKVRLDESGTEKRNQLVIKVVENEG